MVEFSPATREARVRFPVNANFVGLSSFYKNYEMKLQNSGRLIRYMHKHRQFEKYLHKSEWKWIFWGLMSRTWCHSIWKDVQSPSVHTKYWAAQVFRKGLSMVYLSFFVRYPFTTQEQVRRVTFCDTMLRTLFYSPVVTHISTLQLMQNRLAVLSSPGTSIHDSELTLFKHSDLLAIQKNWLGELGSCALDISEHRWHSHCAYMVSI